ncbi:hypothetical protein FO519_002556 [Halicephalobus sp. NKZ332]|nr:hypothetical protein FO519_002556 [Halicephalobus sp. NKZ332]
MNDSITNSTGQVDQLNPLEFYFYVINGSLGTIFNTLVLFIALRHADTYDKPRQIIVINMTWADLMTCLIYMITRPYISLMPEQLCYSYYVVIFTNQMCSCLNLLWLNFDKLIYIKFPLHYYTIVTRTRVLVLTVFSWVGIISLACGIYFFMNIKQPCSLVALPPFLYSVICLTYISIILASFAISAVIYCIARNSRRAEPEAGSRMFQRLFFVFSSTIWTCITCLPYRLLYLMYLLLPSMPEYPMYLLLLDSISAFFPVVVVGIVINPWITILTQRMYRECFLLYLRKLGSVFGLCGFRMCTYQDTKTRRQSRPSIGTQRSSAAFSECKKLNEAADV